MALGFGIVGCGMIADFHARAIAETSGAKLIGGTSRNLESANRFSAKHQCRAYRDLAEMLRDDAVGAVVICTPSGAHRDPALAAARAGRHVVVEKPLEITLARCDSIIKACDQAGVQLATIFQSRFSECWQQLKRAIDQGRFGRLALGDAYVKWYRTQQYYDQGAWRGTWKLDGGGALMNQAIHTVDLLLWLMGPVSRIAAHSATVAHERIEVEDVLTASLQFESGALGTLEATTAAFPGYQKKIEIHGSQGSVSIEEDRIVRWEFAKPMAVDRQIQEQMTRETSGGGGAADPSAISHAGHRAQYRDFVAAVRRDRKPAIDGHEGRRSVALTLAAYRSAKLGKSVKV